MNKEKPLITLMLGPGNHQDKLISALKNTKQSFEIFNYYPFFCHIIFNSQGEKIHYSKNTFLTNVVKLLWSVIIRIKPLKNKNYHTYINYIIFDWWAAANVSKSSCILWAWSQVSLKTIKKFKKANLQVILENPMIHVNDWVSILEHEYRLFAPNNYRYYHINKQLLKRMKQEYELANKIVLLSDFAAKSFENNGIKKEKLILTNLYAYENHALYEKTKPVSSDLNLDKKTNFIFVGRIDILKGIPRLLKALDSVYILNQNFKITFVGELKEDVANFFSKERSFVELAGVKSGNDLIKHYQNADVLILPSVQESFGLVLLEALSNGLRVLASENTGAPDIAKECDNIKIFNPFNVEKIEEAILSEIINHKYQALNECNLNKYTSQYYRYQIHEIISKVSHTTT